MFGSLGGGSTVWLVFSGAVSAVLPPILTVVVFAVVYYHLPNARVQWPDAAFGGIVAVILFEFGKHLFFWLTSVSIATQRSAVYGPMAGFVVLLMWAFAAGLIFLYGAALVKAARELRPIPHSN